MRRAAWALVLVLLGASAARAGGDEPLGDGTLARVKLGWEGFAPNDSVSPVSVTLTNAEDRERTFRVVVSPHDGEKAEETVTLGPRAKRRVSFALRLPQWTTVSVSEGSALLVRGSFSAASLPDHAVLLVDGEPDTLQVPEVATGCIVVATRPEELPSELACLARLNGVILRHVDPSRIEPRARGALDDLIRAGGTVVVVAPDDRPSLRAIFDECDPATERTDGPFPVRRRGLGFVGRIAEDVGANATGLQAQARAALGAVLLATQRTPFPRAHLGEHPNDSATAAGVLFGGFLLLYIVAAGPVFAFAMRKKKAGQVARALAVLLGAFLVLGVTTAALVRGGAGVVRVTSYVIVPSSGDPLVLADVTLQSAGRRTQDVTIEGDDVAATSFGRTGRRLQYRPWTNERHWYTETAQTERAVGHHAVSFAEHPLPSFGEASIAVLAGARGWKRIPAKVVAQRGRPTRVVVSNTLDHDLGALLVCERVPRRGVSEFARADALPKGATLELSLGRTPSLTPKHLNVPSGLELVGWLDVAPPCADGSMPRFVLYAEDRSPLTVKAAGARIDERSWRVQDVDAPAATVPGYLGVQIKQTKRGLKIVSVTPGSPAASANWVLSPGRVIVTIAGTPVRTPEDLRRILLASGPGTTVKIVTSDNTQVDLELGDPPAAGTASPLTPGQDDEGE